MFLYINTRNCAVKLFLLPDVIGLHVAIADKSKVLTKIQAKTVKELKTVSRGSIYIISPTSFILSSDVRFWCYGDLNPCDGEGSVFGS